MVCELWLVDFDPFCVLCFKVLCLWSWLWLTAAKNAIKKGALKIQSSRVFESAVKDDPENLEFGCSVCYFLSIQQECIFKKTSDNTGLRVYWSGHLRIYNCNSCCRRWYFTFNDAECSAPAAIDATVYMYRGAGSRINNLYRPRHVEGVCDKIHKGTVRVGFWVGNCSGFGSADAATGWNSVSRIYVEEVPPPQV